jgi:DNA-binding NarL/FixJ family response regulator
VRGAIESGAAGFIPKTAQGSTLRAALDVVLGGGVYLPGSPIAPAPAGAPERALDLSPRQLEVLHLLIRGASNKHICRELSMAESTVKTHVQAIFRRLEVSNRTQAVFTAARMGLRQPQA